MPEWSQPDSEWLSLQQAAVLLGISVDTVRRRIAAGVLPASRCGARLIRVRTADLDSVFRPIVVGQPTVRRRRPW
ncbi:MAG: helix-turn-helix domain-containing protein [Propionibacteriaceae bacterium]|nr:helix-turn-helix domain-containing protein [Propionibacteriaceae bacterium]